jgi:hypothetical protein
MSANNEIEIPIVQLSTSLDLRWLTEYAQDPNRDELDSSYGDDLWVYDYMDGNCISDLFLVQARLLLWVLASKNIASCMAELIPMLRQQSIGTQITWLSSYINAKSSPRGPNDETQNDQLDIVLVIYQ